MNLEDYINGIDCFTDTIQRAAFHEIAVRDTVAKQSERIFIDGKASDGGQIGGYNAERPLYVSPKKVPKEGALLPLKGKTGKSEFKSGKPHKTRYVESYKKLRELMGLQSDKVDFNLFGNLKSDFENGGRGTDVVPLKVDNLTLQVTLDSENEKKKEGLENRFRTVFDLTNEEVENVSRIGERELIKELNRCLAKS